MIEHIKQRRAALAAQFEQAKRQYEQLEQTLIRLDRQIHAMEGGLQELDALLSLPLADDPPPSESPP